MRTPVRTFALVGGGLLALGCSGIVDPLPEVKDRGHGMDIGLDATPEVTHRGAGYDTGLRPLPEVKDRGHGMDLGLDATPRSGPDAAPAPATEGARRPVAVAAAEKTAAPAPATTPVPQPAPPPPPPPARLRLKFETGSVRKFRNVMEQTIRIPSFGEMGNTDTRMEMDVTNTIASGDAERGVMKTSFDAMTFKMNNPMMGELTFDTRKPETLDAFREQPMVMMQPALGAIPDMVGRTTSVALNADGTAVKGSLTGMDELGGSFGPMGAGINVEQMAASMGAMPAEPVRVGLSWSFEAAQDMPMGGSVTTRGIMTVTAWDEATGLATIITEATMSMDLAGAKVPDDGTLDDEQAAAAAEMLANIKIKEGTVKGEEVFDVRNGYRRSSKGVTRMIMEMPNPMNPDEPMEMHMDMSMTMDLVP